MLRRIVFLSCVALVVVLATSSKAEAWGCYRAGAVGGWGGGYRAGAVGGWGGYRAGAVGGWGGYGGYGGYRAGYVRGW
jgi:hypothetical protein